MPVWIVLAYAIGVRILGHDVLFLLFLLMLWEAQEHDLIAKFDANFRVESWCVGKVGNGYVCTCRKSANDKKTSFVTA